MAVDPSLSPREVVLAVWERIFNGHDIDAADDLVAEDYRQHTQGVAGGRDGFKRTFAQYLQMSPDIRAEPLKVQEIGDIVVIRGRIHMGNPPPGHVSPIDVVDIFEVTGGMLRQHWEL